MKKVFKRIAIVVVVPLLLGVGAAWWAMATESGARHVFGWLGAIMKGSLTAARVEGSIKSPLTVYGLTYKSPSLNATIDRARLEWHLSQLLRKRLDIVSFRASGVHIVPAPTPEKKQRERLPDVHLPVNVIVRDAEVTDIRFGSDPKNPLVVDTLSLKTTAIGDTVRVESLSARGPSFSADASGTVRPRGDYPVDLKLAWSLRRPQQPVYAGDGTFSGTLEKLHVVQSLGSPFRASLDALLTAPLRDLRMRADLRVAGLEMTRVQPGGPDANVSGDIHVEGALDAFTASGDVAALVRTNALGRVRADFDVSRRQDRWSIARLDVLLPGTPTRLNARGNVNLPTGGPSFDLTIGWDRISWPLRGKPLASSPNGSAVLSGSLDSYALRIGAVIEGPNLPRGDWKLEGRGDRRQMELASFSGALLGGTLSGNGHVGWEPSLSWKFDVEGNGLDPGTVWKGYPGKIALAMRSEGRMERSGPVGAVEVDQLSGTLRNEPVQASARVDLNGQRIFLRQAQAMLADARISASGEVGKSFDLAWAFDAPELARVLPDSAGSLSGKGRIVGASPRPRIRAGIQGKQLALAGHRIAQLALDADVDLSSRAPSRLDARLTGLTIKSGARPIDRMTAALRGDERRHTFALEASSGKDTFHLAVSGGLERAVWHGEVSRLDLSSQEAGNWTLASAVSVVASTREAHVRDFCWVSGGARVCAAANWKKTGPTDARATIAQLPLAIFSPWLPPDVHVTGNVNGRVAGGVAPGGPLHADASLTAGPGSIQYSAATGAPASAAFRDAALELVTGRGGLRARVATTFEGIGTFAANLEMPQYGARGIPMERQPMRGSVRADLTDIGFVRAFVTTAERVGGALHADLALSGTLGDPRARGHIRLENGRATFPDYGLTLSPIVFTASSDGSGPIRLDGTLGSGGGTLKVTGSSPLRPSSSRPLQISLQGNRFEAYGTEEAHVWVSPAIQLRYDGASANVSGDVTIPETKIDYKQRFATVEPSKDVVFVGGAPQPQAGSSRAPLSISARVRVILGDRVNVKGMGFDGRITGSLLAFDTPGRPTSGTGELRIVKGTYKAYGQDLTVEHGFLRFAGGPIDDPGLDVRAYRKASDGVVAGVNVKGTLKNPSLTVYSDPAMSQGDALAYIILGHPLNQNTSKQEGSLVERAAASLGVAGGNLIAKKLGKRFGLETAKIETTGGNFQSASLVVGKFLSPKLYVEYGLGLFDQLSTIRVEYILSRKWTVRAETGVNNGADLLYTIERGKNPPSPSSSASTASVSPQR